MNTKQLVIFGTRHYTEKRIPPEIRMAMELIVDKSSPTIGLEEWSVNQVERSGFDVVCESKKILWASIGTPPRDDLATYITTPMRWISRWARTFSSMDHLKCKSNGST